MNDAGVSRRTLLVGGGAVGLAVLLAACTPPNPDSRRTATASPTGGPTGGPTPDAAPEPIVLSPEMLAAFDADIATAMSLFGMVGAAVAVFQGDEIVFNRGFGIRDVASGAPVTETTKFRIGSNTKSMTSLLIASYVEDGLCTWDTRVVELWPEFLGPTPELTESLTLAELLGMGTGIAEPETIEFFAAGGGYSAERVLQSIAHLEVIAEPGAEYYYNNTLVASAPYLVMLADGTALADLEDRYAADLASTVFSPIGMTDSVVAADPRPFGPDYANGYTKSLDGTVIRTPFVSIGGFGPAGSVMSSSTDMARYLIAQTRDGAAADGNQIASTENVERTHQPGVAVPPDGLNALPSLLLGDTTGMNYCLGWFDQEFNNGTRLLWHAGGIDGFGSLMGFFPQHDVGFVFLTNLEPSLAGLFNFSIQSSLLDMLFGLNATIPPTLAEAVPTLNQRRADAAASTRPVDPVAVAPYLGLYTDGFQLQLEGTELLLRHDVRTMPVRAVEGGDYLVFSGPGAVASRKVVLAGSGEQPRTMSIDGFETVTWLSGD